MARIYFYKLTVDDGGAPCVQDGLLSLAICKPMIRSSAEKGDMLFGFAANSLHADNRLIYIARVTGKVRDGAYYVMPRFARRGDCIYARRRDRFVRRRSAYHNRPEDLSDDLGLHPDYQRAHVLLSTEFRYFGASGSAEYKRRFPLIKNAVEALNQGHRVQHRRALRKQFLALKRKAWAKTRRKVIGEQTSRPHRNACHRSKSCGVLGDGRIAKR